MHATSRSRRLPTIPSFTSGFLLLSNRRYRETNPELGKGSVANHYPIGPPLHVFRIRIGSASRTWTIHATYAQNNTNVVLYKSP